MKGILSILVSVFWLIGHSQEIRQMTLDDCINYALENNEKLKIAKLEKDISDRNVKEVLAMGLPQVNGQLGVVRNFEIQVTPIQDFISPSVYSILEEENLIQPQDRSYNSFPAAFGTDWNGQAGISVNQLIFDGSFFVGLQSSLTVKELAKINEIKEEVDVIENVHKSYYLVLISLKKLRICCSKFFGYRHFIQRDILTL